MIAINCSEDGDAARGPLRPRRRRIPVADGDTDIPERPPIFPSDSIMDVFARHVEEDPEFPSERLGRSLPEDLECVIMACLAKDPSERIFCLSG